MKAVSVWCAMMITLMVGLSACSLDTPTTEEQRKAALVELEKRGFEDPTFVTDQYGPSGEMRFTAKLDECRIFVSRSGSGVYNFMDVYWTDEQRQAVAEAAGGSASDIVNASFVRKYGDKLGWAHCLKDASAK